MRYSCCCCIVANGKVQFTRYIHLVASGSISLIAIIVVLIVVLIFILIVIVATNLRAKDVRVSSIHKLTDCN